MNEYAVDQYLLVNQKYFPQEKMLFLKEQLLELDERSFSLIYSLDLKDPLILLVISVFLGYFGIDRFLLNDITLGFLKLITCGGCGVWAIVDCILIMDRTKEYNFNKIMNFIYGFSA